MNNHVELLLKVDDKRVLSGIYLFLPIFSSVRKTFFGKLLCVSEKRVAQCSVLERGCFCFSIPVCWLSICMSKINCLLPHPGKQLTSRRLSDVLRFFFLVFYSLHERHSYLL